MARYIVNVSYGGNTVSIVVVLSDDALVTALRDKILERVPGLQLGTTQTDVDVTLHLGAPNGPIIDAEDLLHDAVEDPKTERICAVIRAKSGLNEPLAHVGTPKLSPEATKQGVNKPLRLRVITPELARVHSDVDAIPLLPQDAVTSSTTLSELKARARQHLGLPFDTDKYDELECNCSLAQQIDQHAAINELNAINATALNSLVIVYGTNELINISVQDTYRATLERTAKDHLQSLSQGKHMSVIGGVLDTSSGGERRYLKLPVIAFCATRRHGDKRKITPRPISPFAPRNNPRSFILDLHTSEMSIEITRQNANLSLAEARLDDCTINGILNIYAVKRFAPADAPNEIPQQGKEAIFRQSEAWEHPLGQSERGLANLLSTLRVVASVTHASHMQPVEQDAILHVFYLLTRFPPAVRGLHTLMIGKSPSRPERAALAQSTYEVLKTVVPLRMIRSDSTRLFEGSRLLFGLILEKARHLKVSMKDQDETLAYINARTIELRNMITMEPVANPVQTVAGLIDRGLYDAFSSGGFLRWTNGVDFKAAIFDRQLHRAAPISGGTRNSIISFDIDQVTANKRYADRGDVDRVIAATEYSDLQYLATLCARNQLGVVHPSSLPGSDSNVLTLDRQGLLAVYIGRQGCGEVGRDITMFRPTTAALEESVGVSIITQLLVPIINRRTADGTAIFEGFGGDQYRQLKDPDEVLMLVLDCSASMDRRCGFIDVEENEDAVQSDNATSSTDNVHSSDDENENFRFERPVLDDLKNYLATHESFSDMLAIVSYGSEDFHRQKNAQKVLTILRGLARAEIKAKEKELNQARLRVTNFQYYVQAGKVERNIATLKNHSLQLRRYKDALGAFLLYRVDNSTIEEPLLWAIQDGAKIPKIPRKATALIHNPEFSIPHDYLCPISSEIMDDPVTTVDNFQYDRRNIERWFMTHETSPCTNMVLTSLELRPNVSMKESMDNWLKAQDILSKYASSQSPQYLVTFKFPLNQWSLSMPANITIHDVYECAFRGTKGRYSKFQLHQRNTLLHPSGELAGLHLTQHVEIVLTPVDMTFLNSSNANENGALEELCLVKVYSDHNAEPCISFWEPKNSKRTLGSAIFAFYRAKFFRNPSTWVEDPFVIWSDLGDHGDSSFHGHTRNNWERLAKYFTREHCKGRLAEEFAYSITDEEQGRTLGSGYAGPLVLKLDSSRASPEDKPKKNLSRIEVLVQMFETYINRILAYSFQTHIGLVTVRSTASITQPITHSIENFRHELNNITADGDTACWDGIALAHDQLLAYAQKYPKAKLRILCLSDGEDNRSSQKVHEVSMKLMRDNILLDSFCLGQADNIDLKALSYLTGGYKFQPYTLEEAMAICELEPVLSQLERADIELPSHARRQAANPMLRFQRAQGVADIDIVNRDIFPQRKEHPQLSESFVELGQFGSNFSLMSRTDTGLRTSRILGEIRNAGAKPHPHYDIYVCEANMGLWKVVLQGPPGSSYATGTFALYLDMEDSYPSFAPKGRFITPIYHPNINKNGRICHSIFDRNWAADTTNVDVLNTVYSLLLVPEFSDPINAVVTLNYHWDEVQFKEEVIEHIQKHATKTRAQFKREIVG